uniref:Uncharacterized protein n=1 Tax=Eutreptiella gymnastica TaxID=73025 RepID=A0A7S4LHZ5_9EUGL
MDWPPAGVSCGLAESLGSLALFSSRAQKWFRRPLGLVRHLKRLEAVGSLFAGLSKDVAMVRASAIQWWSGIASPACSPAPAGNAHLGHPYTIPQMAVFHGSSMGIALTACCHTSSAVGLEKWL